MDSFIETFHIDWQILIAQAINFVVVFVVLYLLALKPLKKIMAERNNKIKKGVADAETNAELLDKTQKEYNAILAKARTEAHEIFQEGKKEAEANKTQIIEDAKTDVENMIEKGKKTIESEKNKMIEEASKEVVSLVVKATEKLLESNPDKTFDDKTLDKIKNI